MTVYFIRPVGARGPVKIGFTARDVAERLKKIDAYSPLPLEVAAAIEGPIELEQRFHALFEHLHLRAEWFRAGPELEQAIERVRCGTFDLASLPAPKRVGHMPWTPERRVRASEAQRAWRRLERERREVAA